MKESCSSISKLLEKYFDQEVTVEERSVVESHLQDCSSCQDSLKAMEGLRHLIKAPVDEAYRKEDFYWVWQKIEREIRQEKRPSWEESLREWLNGIPLFRKRVWIPAVAAIAIFLMVFTPYFYKMAPSSSQASVVEYVESQTHNVMVYELEKNNVTVIWLIEDSEKEDITTS
jgi:anti-sigma factor RsiW